MQPDEADWKIIDILRQGQQTNKYIAEALGFSEPMVRRRIQNLKDAGIIQVKAVLNPDVLDHQQLAVIAVKVAKSSQLEAKAKEIAQLESVLSASIVSGRYDILVELLIDSNKGLITFLTQQLAQVKGIIATESFLLLKNYNKHI